MVLISLIALLNTSIFAQSKLPTLSTKQAIQNLRYFSKDGKVTYYQKSSGDLVFSTNYKATTILKGDKNTQYEIVSSRNKNNLVISKKSQFFTNYNLRKVDDIYKVKYGTDVAIKIGQGIKPQLHLDDSWISFFDPITKVITFQNIDNSAINFKIKTSNILNPYYVPKRIMLKEKSVLFTDINSEGYPGILHYEVGTKKLTTIQKYPTPNIKVEFCLVNSQILTAVSGFDSLEKGTEIRLFKKDSVNFSESTELYTSKHNDPLNIKCDIDDKNIYFVKHLEDDNKKINFEVVRLNITDKKEDIISDLKFVGQLIELDGSLYIPYHGQYYVLLGENNLTQFDLLKRYKDSEKEKKK